jgi:hypothetical protein
VTAIEEFRIAAEHFVDVVRRAQQYPLDGPGLGEWNLRALIGHTARSVLTVETYLDRPAPRVEIESPAEYYEAAQAVDPAAVVERGRQAGDALGDDPAGFVAAAVSRTLAKLNQPDDYQLETVVGGMRLGDYLPTRVFELVTHGLDICRAIGLAMPPPERVLASALALATQISVRRGDGPTVLLAVTGRASLPPGFSVV